MPIMLDGEVNNPLRPLADYSLPFGEYLSTKFADQFANNPMSLLGKAASVQEAQSGQPMIDTGYDLTTGLRISPEPDPVPVVQLDATTARERIKEAGVTLTVPETGIGEEALNLLIEHRQEDTARQAALQRSPSGVRSIAGFGASFAAGLLDPLNVAAGFVPVVGEERYLAMLANTSGAFGRAGVRAGVGAVEGAVGTAALEPVIYFAHQQLQDDYKMTDSLVNIAFGGVLGGGLHAGAGVVKDVTRGAPAKNARSSDSVRPDVGVEEAAAAMPDAPNLSDRRWNADRRKAVAEMSPEEMRQALLVDDMTGLGNRRAYNEVSKNAFQASIDIDSLKWVNDNLGHEGGDQLIVALGRALREESADAYHLSGDEFTAQFADEAEGHALLARVRDRLKGAEIEATLPDGSVIIKKGVEFSYGIADTIETADQRLRADKSAREANGERAGRGNEPAGVSKKPAARQQDNQGNAAAAAAQEVTPPPAAELIAQAAPETRELALRSAVAQAMDGRVPNIEPIIREKAAENFAYWFGDSKVVSDDGRPLVVFHGSSKDFESFSNAHERNLNLFKDAEGFYFTSRPDDAAAFVKGENPAVYPAYLSIKNPIHTDVPPSYISPQMRADLEAKGHDGIIYKNEKLGIDEYVVFRSEQIKSAIGNSGRFDPGSSSLIDSITPDEIRAAAERQALPESRLTNDKAASDAAAERLKTAPKNAALETAEQELQRAVDNLAGVRKNLEQGGFSPEALKAMDEHMKPFDDAMKQADEFGKAVRAAALCGLRN